MLVPPICSQLQSNATDMLVQAVFDDDVSTIWEAVALKDCDIDAQLFGETPLHFAIEYKRVDCV